MLWHCLACTTAYSVGAPCCPHCGSTEYGENMAKITVHGGPSDKTLPVVPAPAVELPVEEAETVEEVEEVEIAAEEPGPGPEVVAAVTEYDAWLLQPLRDECGRRGLAKYGNKDELVARLVANDAAALEVPAEVEADEAAEG